MSDSLSPPSSGSNYTTGVEIKHKLNGGEVLIGRFKVNGQSRQDSHVIYEFNGCFWHGCLKCYPNQTIKLPVVDQTAKNLYQRTLDCQLCQQQRSYQMMTKWKCELKTDLASNPQMAGFFKSCNIVDHLCTNAQMLQFDDVGALAKEAIAWIHQVDNVNVEDGRRHSFMCPLSIRLRLTGSITILSHKAINLCLSVS
jgi:hypothetical protein